MFEMLYFQNSFNGKSSSSEELASPTLQSPLAVNRNGASQRMANQPFKLIVNNEQFLFLFKLKE